MYSQDVIAKIEAVRASSRTVDFRKINVILANLTFMHQVMKASIPLMQEAAALADKPLRNYLLSHIEEEHGHVEWLGEDLKAYGVNVDEIAPIRRAVAMAGSQYYLIKHVSPYCLLGYMAVLEGFPVSLDVVDVVEGLHGKQLFRTLRYHCEHDLEHRKELFRFIDANPQPEIMGSAIQTAIYMNELADDLNMTGGEAHKESHGNE